MRLWKRGDTYWAIYYIDGKRFRQSTKCHDKAAALEVAKRFEREAADPSHPAKIYTLDQALGALVAERKKEALAGRKSASTATFYEWKAGPIVRIMGHEARTCTLTAAKIDAYIDQRRTEKTSENTISKELVALRSALRLAKRRGLWEGEIDKLFPIRFSPQYKPRKRWLTPDEVVSLLPHLWLDHAARLAFIVATSASLSDTVRALRSDVKDREALLRGLKTPTRWRTVPVITDWQKKLMEYAQTHAQGINGQFFSQIPRDFQSALKRAALKAKIEPLSPNDLRRTAAQWLVQQGASNATAARVLGHTDTTMIDRVYGRLEGNALAARLAADLKIEGCDTFVTNPLDADGKNGQNGRQEWLPELPLPKLTRRFMKKSRLLRKVS